MKLTTNVVLLSPGFSLTGSPLSQLVLVIIALPLAIGFYSHCKDKGQKADKTLASLMLGGIIVGLLASIYTVFKNQPFLMPVDSSWRVATGTLGDSIRAAFLGTGPANYVDAYSIFKPTNMNVGNLWNLRFSTASNFYFYVLTTLGIAGLASMVLLVVKFTRLARERFAVRSSSSLEKGLLSAAAVALLTIAIVPAATTTIFAIFIVLGLLMALYKVSEINVVTQVSDVRNAGEIRLGLVIVSLAGIALAGYFLGRLALADYYMGMSFNSARNNKGTDTYNQQVKAIALNPWSDSYRVTFAQTNLALADSLAGQTNLTDQQRQAVVQLVQQSIREARNAVSLQPQRAANWENLSLIYRNLINFAQGSDQWAVVTQNQAIALDPVNPRLRLDLGGIYYALGNYQAAAQVFSQAVNLKPDYANAHYNLAQSLKQLKVDDQALAQLQLTASLVCSQDSQTADCQRVNAEITALGSTPASPAAGLNQNKEEAIAPATPSGSKNLPNAKTTPPVRVGSPSGEIGQ
jgi:tetratricopeptide (TPR) repeat protein